MATPTALSTLFTDVASVAALLGATGFRLRTDDAAVTPNTITGATNTTPIVITSVDHGLQTGDLVQISEVKGNTWANGVWYVIRLSVDTFSLTGSVGVAAYTTGGKLWGITYPESDFIEQGPNLGTAKVMRFCQTLYDVADMASSWSCWNWATIIAAHWFCCRRGNPVPETLMNLYLESLEELNAVKNQEMVIEDIGYRNEVMPTWSALRIDRRFSVKQLRTVAIQSSRNKPQFPRANDLAAQIIGPVELNSL